MNTLRFKYLLLFIICCFISCNTIDKKNITDNTYLIENLNNVLSEIAKSDTVNRFDYSVKYEFSKDNNEIKCIEISNLGTDSIPSVFNNFTDLSYLSLTNCNISKIGNFSSKKLISLNLDNNKFEIIPDLNAFERLNHISISNNNLKGELNIKLKKISNLNLSFNRIDNISFTNPQELEYLSDIDISYNCIKNLDNSFYLLPNLKVLSLQGNYNIKFKIRNLKKLEVLKINKAFKFNEAERNYIKNNKIIIVYY